MDDLVNVLTFLLLHIFFVDVNTGGAVQPLSSYFTLSKCSLVFKPKLCSRQKIVCGKETVRLTAGKNFRNMDVRLRIKLGPILSSDAVWKDNDFPVVDVSCSFVCFICSSQRYPILLVSCCFPNHLVYFYLLVIFFSGNSETNFSLYLLCYVDLEHQNVWWKVQN